MVPLHLVIYILSFSIRVWLFYLIIVHVFHIGVLNNVLIVFYLVLYLSPFVVLYKTVPEYHISILHNVVGVFDLFLISIQFFVLYYNMLFVVSRLCGYSTFYITLIYSVTFSLVSQLL